MTPEEWRKRLIDTSSNSRRVLSSLKQVEAAYGSKLNDRFRGFVALDSAFQSFLLETLLSAEQKSKSLPREGFAWYRPVLLGFVGALRLLRVGDTVFRAGYPLNGYALLRDLKDRAFMYAAVIQGVATFEAVNGWHATGEVAEGDYSWEHAKAARKARTKVENDVREYILGKKSGFTVDVQAELKHWNEMFHMEVHGGRLTYAIDGAEWLTQNAALPIYPSIDSDRDNAGIYINHVEQVQWMLLRCLCYLRVEDSPFTDTWHDQWSILNDSFAIVRTEAVRDQRSTANEFLQLLNTKFAFSPHNTHYWEKSNPQSAA